MMTLMMVAVAQSATAHSWGHAGGWGWWWLPYALVFWIGLGAVVAYLLIHLTGRPQPSGVRSAREILAERFARGEIDPEEYEERLSHLA